MRFFQKNITLKITLKKSNIEIRMNVNLLSELNQDELYTLYKSNPNWFELGKKVRSHFNDIRLTQLYLNDYRLGEVISNFFKKSL